ncbi:tyrosine-protein phosphatase [Streptomyces sp. NPDC005708]
MAGVPNARYLGGLQSDGGRRVRCGRIYRSGSLSELSPWPARRPTLR